ncbi:MAG: dienelactone hydrolase family protein [bacterium]
MVTRTDTTGTKRAIRIGRAVGFAAVAAAFVATACGGEPAKDAKPAVAADAAASVKSAPPSATPHTGALSEEAFKALHELKEGVAPATRGTMIEIVGSRAYLSLPADAKPPLAGVIVIQEWWGLNEHVKHWADRISAEGYAAIAVDLYGGRVATTPDSAMAYMKSVDDTRALEILQAAHAFLANDSRVQAKKTASIGWCFGGAWSLRLALAAPDLDGAVMYYGHPITDPAELKKIHAPVFGVFGTLDQSIPPATVAEFEKGLAEAGVPHEIHSYEALHAFANPSNPRYDTKAAADAWAKVSKFLRSRLSS